MLSICVFLKEGREPQGMLWVGGSLRGCCGWEGASGDVMGGREPQGMLWGGGGPFGNVDRLVCVCVCLHVCIVCVCHCVRLCV